MSISRGFSHRSYLRYIILTSVGLLALLLSHASYAVCSSSGSTSGTYNYTSSSIATNASVTMSGTIVCYTYSRPFWDILGLFGTYNETSQARICVMASFDGTTSSNGGRSLPVVVYGTVGGGGNTSNMLDGVWYGPVTTSRSGNTITYNVSLMVPAQNQSLVAYPIGTYMASATIYWDMQSRSGTCDRNTTQDYSTNADSGSMTLTASYVIPKFCQVSTTANMNFGNVSGINVSRQNYDATGALSSTCNSGTAYSIQLGLGDHYSNSLGLRRMYNPASQEYLAYDLYADASRTRQWNTNQVVNLTGTGNAQTSTVYGRIPNIAQTAVSPGTYSDTVIVTVSY
ncbi:spore coat protein U domain-containing protein [Acinetobacter sp. B5B]|uniref:Csu type fimbrial protein n=1 Tax=Acinetobacter baretiae TaxID=2605383 RepID=UPI0018C32239|nr:spore coat U domain-containing protein [Acinetobacter baretiae]MBF7683544.1 spore coat protein U domain-containing protein [Acinetobacter baretiae]